MFGKVIQIIAEKDVNSSYNDCVQHFLKKVEIFFREYLCAILKIFD